MKKQTQFFYIQPQIVGNANHWGYAFHTDGFRYWTKEKRCY